MRESAIARMDARTAVEVMGWIMGGPDDEFWVLPEVPAGNASVFRMPVTRWRPTTDPFCRELLVERLRERGLSVGLEEAELDGGRGYACRIADAPDAAPRITVTAPSAGMAVVCAALAWGAQG